MGSNIVRFSQLVDVPATGIPDDAFIALGEPFDHAMRVVHLINDSNGYFVVSFDGVTENIILLADSFVLYDLTSDQDANESFRYQAGTQMWIKALIVATSTATQTDAVYLTTIYGKGE